ncbi:accessory factor UbiK family protein [Rhodoligotrophos defluvii]|uniref:accessory factor UbiK family protein n=1 Tax=Rhodoligotrophos defluvii TaxID=2561934 RepID=UPI0010C9E33A|nr:accessory factor UbiK family protein [Rhodoligotrophos defluvii]
MTNPSSRIFDEMARMFGTAATAAQSLRGEFDTMIRSQAERILNGLDIVKREEFEAVREMARLAREDNERLQSRIAALEKVVADLQPAQAASPTPAAQARKPRTRSAKPKSAEG